jgi:hypothetical protein
MMFYLELLQLIEDNADELTRKISKDLLTRAETKGYRILSDKRLSERVYDVCRNLSSWLGKDEHTRGEIKRIYTEIGKKRYREGIPLHEVLLAFMLIKSHLWLFVQEKNFFNSKYELSQALELNNNVVFFFDRVIYFVTMGYQEALLKEQG